MRTGVRSVIVLTLLGLLCTCGEEENPASSVDTTPPPAPVLESLLVEDHKSYEDDSCVGRYQAVYVEWKRPDAGDVAGYKIYRKGYAGSEYTLLIAKVPGQCWHKDDALAGDSGPYTVCYAVSAYDRQGNESPMSREKCVTVSGMVPCESE